MEQQKLFIKIVYSGTMKAMNIKVINIIQKKWMTTNNMKAAIKINLHLVQKK